MSMALGSKGVTATSRSNLFLHLLYRSFAITGAMMPATINEVTLMGNIGRAPCWTTLPNGMPVCTVSLATDDIEEDWRTGHKLKVTHWHRVILTGDLATSMRRRLAKGDSLYVEGKVCPRHWTGRSGATQYLVEVVAKSVLVYPKPVARPRLVKPGGPLLTDPDIAEFIAEYDRADARYKAELAEFMTPPMRTNNQVMPPRLAA